MAMGRKQGIYRRLPGRPIAVFTPRSLWQGPDHLLWVKASMVREYYKRFYYKEIQSIVLQRDNRYRLWNFIWGMAALLFLLMALIVSGTPYASGLFLIMTVVGLLVNLVCGPTCVVFIQTAVQVEKLLSLTRVRTACKAIAQIRALVQAVQGRLDLDRLEANRLGGAAPSSRTMVSPASPASTENTRHQAVSEPFKPLLHRILFGLLLGAGVCRTVQLWAQHTALALVDMFLLAATLALVIVVVVRWFHQVKGTMLAKITWLTLVLTVAHGLTSYVFYIIISMRNPRIAQNEWALLSQFFNLQMSDHPAARAAGLILAFASLALGAAGLLTTLRKRAG